MLRGACRGDSNHFRQGARMTALEAQAETLEHLESFLELASKKLHSA